MAVLVDVQNILMCDTRVCALYMRCFRVYRSIPYGASNLFLIVFFKFNLYIAYMQSAFNLYKCLWIVCKHSIYRSVNIYRYFNIQFMVQIQDTDILLALAHSSPASTCTSDCLQAAVD